jgi:hypothetical protein
MFKVSYLGQEAVRCALATPAEGDGVNLVATHYPLCCTVLLCGNFFSSLVSFYNPLRTIPQCNCKCIISVVYKGRKEEKFNDIAFCIGCLHIAFSNVQPLKRVIYLSPCWSSFHDGNVEADWFLCRMPVMEFQSTDADVICTKLTVLKNDATISPVQRSAAGPIH